MADKVIRIPQGADSIPLRHIDQGDGTYVPQVTSDAAPIVATSDFDPPLLPVGWVGNPRQDERRNSYVRQSWRDVAAKAYENIIDQIGLANLPLILPFWELQGSPFRNLVNRDKTWTAWNGVSPAQPGGLHQIVGLDGATGYIQQDPTVANYYYTTADTSLTGGTFLAGQQFVPTTTEVTSFVRLRLGKIGSPNASIRAFIYNDAAGAPGSQQIGSTALACSLITSTGLIGLTFANTFTLVAGTTYWLVLGYSSVVTVDASNYIQWYYDSALHVGGWSVSRYNGTTWTPNATQAFSFDIYDNSLQLGTAANASWTIFCGAKSTQPIGTVGYLFDLSSTIGVQVAYFRTNTGNTYSAQIHDAAGASLALTVATMPLEYVVWALSFSMVNGAAKTSLYRNGLLLATANGSPNVAAPIQAQPLTFGAQQGSYGFGQRGSVANQFSGSIGPFILANQALTPAQIGQVTTQLLAMRLYQEAI